MKDLIKEISRNKEGLFASRYIADSLKKRHNHVIRDIDELISNGAIDLIINQNPNMDFDDEPICIESYYKAGTGKKYKEYLLNDDAVRILASRYDARLTRQLLKIVKTVIQWAKDRKEIRLENKELTDSLKRFHEGNDKPYHYSNENFMLYDILFECSSRKLKKDQDIENFRDIMTPVQIKRFKKLQKHDESLIELGYDYNKRKDELISYYNKLKQRELK